MNTTQPLALLQPGREADPPAQACQMRELCVPLLVHVTVAEGIEPRHVVEYAQALLGNREHDLHEDIFDELGCAAMQVSARAEG